MKKQLFLISITIILCSFNSFSQNIGGIRFEDKIRLREAYAIGQEFGDKLWDGYNEYLIQLF